MRRDWVKSDVQDMNVTKETTNPYGYYDNKKFWDEYGKDYIHSFGNDDQKKMEENLLLNARQLVNRIIHLCPLDNILEIGSGFGRILGWMWVNRDYIKFKRLEGIEISKAQIDNGLQYFKDCKLETDDPLFPKMVLGDAANLPYKDKEFDLIYTHVCLTHIPPDKLRGVLNEINRVARKFIILTERFQFPYEHSMPHVWSHDLPPFFRERGWDMINCAEIHSEHKTKVYVMERK